MNTEPQTTEQGEWVLVHDDCVSRHSPIEDAKLVRLDPAKGLDDISLSLAHPANVLNIAAYPGVVEVLGNLEVVFPRDGENANDKLERLADLFYAETGIVHPSKDVAAAMGHDDVDRRAKYSEWFDAKVVAARAALSAVHPKGGKT